MVALLADIGGTNTRCALSGGERPRQVREFMNEDFSSPGELLATYLSSLPAKDRPRDAYLAVAAPICGERAEMININWQLSAGDLCRELRLDAVRLLNDFEALAWALPVLEGPDLLQIGGGAALPHATKAVLGPGTGFGVAYIVPVNGGWRAMASEGGHVTLPASDEREAELIRKAREQLGHCSAERLISGPGLALMHGLLHHQPPPEPTLLGALADAGDTAALDTLDMMFRLLGTVASDLALTVGAQGGVYIGGGILPRYAQRFAASGFRQRFEDKGRYSRFLRRVPTWLIISDNPTLDGLLQRVRSRRRQ